MRLRFDEKVEAFRAEFVAWLAAHRPSEQEMAADPARSSAHVPGWARRWAKTLFDAGWLVPGWPPGLGGRNAGPVGQLVYLEELERARVPRTTNPQGLGIITPSILDYGSKEQVEGYALPVLRICTITVRNNGLDRDDGANMALGVTLKDEYLSNGTFAFGAITATKGDFVMPADTCVKTANPQVKAGTVSCDLGDLDGQHELTVAIPVTAQAPQNVNDRATAASDSPDPNLGNNWAEDELNWEASADLQVWKDCKPDDMLLTGDPGKCTINVHNFGPSTATSVNVTDTHITAGGQPFTIDGVVPGPGPNGCSIAGRVVTCNFASILSGSDRTIEVTITEGEPMDINDQAVAESPVHDPDHTP